MTQLLQTRTCPECGKEFEAIKARNGRTPQHCSKKCYLKGWQKHNKQWRKETASGERVQIPAVAPICEKCGTPKTWSKDGRTKHGFRWRCTPCKKVYHKNYYLIHGEKDNALKRENYDPEAMRRENLWNKYKITVEQRDEILKRQGGCCAVCRNKKSKSRWGDGSWYVDHCHTTGEVRGLLCRTCNVGLGHFEDNTLFLQQAIDYLNGGNRDLVSAVLNTADEEFASC